MRALVAVYYILHLRLRAEGEEIEKKMAHIPKSGPAQAMPPKGVYDFSGWFIVITMLRASSYPSRTQSFGNVFGR